MNANTSEESRLNLAVRSSDRYDGPMSEIGLVHIVDDDAGVRKALSSLIRSVGNDVRVY